MIASEEASVCWPTKAIPGSIAAGLLDSAAVGTICDHLERHADLTPTRTAYTFLSDRGRTQTNIDYVMLRDRVRTMAGGIVSVTVRQEPVACIFDSGLDFVVAFLSCLWSGRIAVPIAPPRPNEPPALLDAIVRNAGITTAIASRDAASRLKAVDGLAISRWLDVSAVAVAPPINFPIARREDVALLQYTSGSTAAPKGVIIGHDNLLANAAQIAASFEHDATTIGLTWLPLQHDMGLIGGVIHPLFVGFRSYLMSPIDMVRDPATWLRMISELRVSSSGGPNFAYEQCLRRVSATKMATLDLSCWQIAFCGAEPIAADTLARFADHFAGCGFKPAAFLPCYGLAEATLQASGVAKSVHYATARPADRKEAALDYVGCGWPVLDQGMLIWDGSARRIAAPGVRGEICLSGPNVAKGYWRDPAATRATFGTQFPGVPGTWLRTGDIGFIDRRHGLCICGRSKALIVIRGANHCLEDIEATARVASPEIAGQIVAAYGMQDIGGERLIVVQEVPRGLNHPDAMDDLSTRLRERIGRAHGIAADIRLVATGSIPRTRSGKIQRHLCVARHLSDDWAAASPQVAVGER